MKNKRAKDPFLEREKTLYQEPLPSRELILEVLQEQGVPVAVTTLTELLSIEPSEVEIFARRLRAMERDGQIMRNRKDAICVVDKLDLIKGKVQGHPEGYGFLIPEEGVDLFLGPKEMRKVLHGDKVMAREIGLDRRGRPEAVIVEVLERANHRVVGRVHNEHGITFVVAEQKRISQEILVAPDQTRGVKPGQVVMVEIIEQPNKNAQPIGKIVEILGNFADPGMEIEIALRKHSLPYEFSPEIQKAVKKFAKTVGRPEEGRIDIRHLPLVTIDGETAKDFDDAVYCEVIKAGSGKKRGTGGGFRLFVAIADVSYYVKPGDAIDKEALNRGNSVYFPRRVIPMLPEVLSNGLCSLNPNVDRLCMVCEMDISANGDLEKYRFYPGIINSKARLTYTEVAAFLEGKTAPAIGKLGEHIVALNQLFGVLLTARHKRGAIDFESIETQMIFNAEGKIERILPVLRNDAHRIIEECMLAANVCASDYLQKNEHPTLYRIHEGPSSDKLKALRTFLKEFGFSLGGGEKPHAKDYAKLLQQIKGRPDTQLLQTVMLRSLHQAIYSPDNVGHFGLAYESYTHFTSPIRRYPDLLVHRAIKAVLGGTVYSPGNWHELGAHSSMTERRADDATRDVEAWLKSYYMQDKIGEIFDATISGVTGFGIFVALDEVYVEGLVHVTELGNDYFHFDAAKHQLLGERTAQRFRLGDRVRIRVVRVDLETTRIDFALEATAKLAEKKPKTKIRERKSRESKPQTRRR